MYSIRNLSFQNENGNWRRNLHLSFSTKIHTARAGSHTIGHLYSRRKHYVGMESIFTESSSVVANEIGAVPRRPKGSFQRITEHVGFCVTIIVATQLVENPNHRRRELVFTLATWKAPASITSSLGYQDPCHRYDDFHHPTTAIKY
ncbi:hypothetical protein FA15DRAFT_268003 [Coprinopsis marcescibilis]|uniref:Uncharacterized protein n=1 Tax=Coprinopsis marcescibilis TaxID=230819 RepID=A0A5C3KEL8_COPMA|nr:hypothetical protein FA15DRAFT_268003 [Coprinopsis marcescibilis]